MHGPSDRLGAGMLVGALAGFVVGAIIGMSSPDLSEPVVAPLVGAIAGVAIGWFAFAYGETTRRRQRHRDLDRAHDRIRADAHQGWIDGVELGAFTPRREDDASARRTPPG